MINHVGMVKQISYFQILDKTLADKSILPEEARTVFPNQISGKPWLGSSQTPYRGSARLQSQPPMKLFN